jgi:hypothetical protein
MLSPGLFQVLAGNFEAYVLLVPGETVTGEMESIVTFAGSSESTQGLLGPATLRVNRDKNKVVPFRKNAAEFES